MLTPESIRRVREDANIITVIGADVQLKRNGSSGFVGSCPFHGEKTASFNVNPKRGIYKCFGCQKGGDVIAFVREFHNLDFVEACERIAQSERIELTYTSENREAYLFAREQSVNIRATLRTAQEFFLRALPESREALDEIARRGWTDETVAAWGIGYAPPGNGLLQMLRSYDLIARGKEAGVLSEGDDGFYDFYRSRLTFPIRTATGDIISFSARDLTGTAKSKYINGPETPVYVKSRAVLGLYEALPAIQKLGFAVLTEGGPDVVSLHQAGVANAVAPCGTALTLEQATLLRKYTEAVTIMRDGDAAGVKAIERDLPILLQVGMEVNVFELKPEKEGEKIDADEWARKMPAEAAAVLEDADG